MSEETGLLMDVKEQYLYIVEGRRETITLPVDKRDVLVNADGEIDCPFDTVLRKNAYSFEDLNKWDAKEILFIQIKEETKLVLRRIQMDVNL